MADPQAEALRIAPNTLWAAKAGAMVVLCLAAGYIIALGWGLLFQTGAENTPRKRINCVSSTLLRYGAMSHLGSDISGPTYEVRYGQLRT